MTHVRLPVTMVLGFLLAGCGEHSTLVSPDGLAPVFGKGTADPTATWKLPLADSGLNFRSDHLYSDGTSSVYANGVCNVSTTIFATSALSNSGDATLNTGSSGRCVRHFIVAYPDGVTETLPEFINLHQIANTSYSIPIGQTVARHFGFSPAAISNTPGRCGRLIFGPNGTVAPGSDSVLVTRADASTWQVRSQAAPNDLAYCETTGQLFHMQVSFTVISSYPLP